MNTETAISFEGLAPTLADFRGKKVRVSVDVEGWSVANFTAVLRWTEDHLAKPWPDRRDVFVAFEGDSFLTFPAEEFDAAGIDDEQVVTVRSQGTEVRIGLTRD